MSTMSRAPLGLGLVLLLSCGGTTAPPPVTGCRGDPRADTFVAGLEKATDIGGYKLKMLSSLRVPPDRGNNEFSLSVVDAAAMSVSTATISVKPWMPDHGHGSTPESFRLRSVGAGTYEVGPINFFMPGMWELTFRIDQSDGQRAVAKFSFCVEG